MPSGARRAHGLLVLCRLHYRMGTSVDKERAGLEAEGQLSVMKSSTMRCASSSWYCTGGDFMK
jgi:hypothetical protein